MRKWRHGGQKAFKFDFCLSDVTVQLNAASSVAVAVDNLLITWQRGHRTCAPLRAPYSCRAITCVGRAAPLTARAPLFSIVRRTESKRARVVEKLDQATGELSRTAQLIAAEFNLPCTLFRSGGEEGGKWDAKLSHIQLADADAEDAGASLLCSVPLDLSAHAASMQVPVYRSRVELELADAMGFLRFTLCSRMLTGHAAEEGASHAGSDASELAADLTGLEREEAAPATPERSARGACSVPVDGVEARWQQVYELERSKADALTIEGLHRDVSALIQDKRTLSEELLRLRHTVSTIPLSRRELAERVADLEAQLAAMRRKSAKSEEETAAAFNSVAKTLEAEAVTLRQQRDEAREKLALAERKLHASQGILRRGSTILSVRAPPGLSTPIDKTAARVCSPDPSTCTCTLAQMAAENVLAGGASGAEAPAGASGSRTPGGASKGGGSTRRGQLTRSLTASAATLSLSGGDGEGGKQKAPTSSKAARQRLVGGLRRAMSFERSTPTPTPANKEVQQAPAARDAAASPVASAR
jgi:hypothetical protein